MKHTRTTCAIIYDVVYRRKNAVVDLKQKRLDAYKAELLVIDQQRKDLLKQLALKETTIIEEKEKTLAAMKDKEAMMQRLKDAGLPT